MKAVILFGLPLLLILLALALFWALALRAKLARLNQTLAGLEDPRLSDEDRRQYALELLERERAQHQDNLTERRSDQ